MLRLFSVLLVSIGLVIPAVVPAADQINLRIRSNTLDDGTNVLQRFPNGSRLEARASRNKIIGYDLVLTIYDVETGDRKVLPMKRTSLKKELEDPPAGANEPACIEWRERCYAHEMIPTKVCDTVCTKIYDAQLEKAVPVTDPEMFYVKLAAPHGKFERTPHEPRKMAPRQQ